MNDESDKLVLAATFDDAAEAALARNRLEAMGVRAVLGEENAAQLGWAATGDMGGIKLLVSDADLARSRYLLAVKPWLEPDDNDSSALATPETLDKIAAEQAEEDEEPPNERELQATRAFKSAVFGLLMPPLLFYAGYLLAGVCCMRGKLQGRSRFHAMAAALLLGVLFAAAAVVISFAVFGPPWKDPGFRLGAHPDKLLGKWQGKAKDGMGVYLDLDAKGNMRCKLTGTAEQEWTGSWKYDNHALSLLVEKVERGPPPPSAIVGWELGSIVNDEVFLKHGDGLLRLTRP